MIYLLPTGRESMGHLPRERFGIIRTPQGGNTWGIKAGYRWAADNGSFTNGFNGRAFMSWLKGMQPWIDTCLFVTCPDAVGDAAMTIGLYEEWAHRFTGWKVAFVAQDGQEDLEFPPQFDVLFIGGTTEWKLSSAALDVIKRAQDLGKWVHVGRVNSLKRVKHFMIAGVDSVDGTCLIYGPDIWMKRIEGWMQHIPLHGE